MTAAVAPSRNELVELAEKHGWLTEVTAPDFWGDVRVTAVCDATLLRLVFDRSGMLLGGYLEDGRSFHTTRRRGVRRWLTEKNGE